MHEDMRTLLNPYLDDELHGKRLMELELHLASCDACQNELKELRLVSNLLQNAPSPNFMPVERFVSNLSLRLPRRTSHNLSPKPSSSALWLIPAGLLGAWFFLQTAFSLTTVVSAANITGLLGQSAYWMGGGHQTIWFAAVTNLFGGLAGGLESALSLLNGLTVVGAKLMEWYLLQALIVLLYLGWLFFWWFRLRPQSIQIENVS